MCRVQTSYSWLLTQYSSHSVDFILLEINTFLNLFVFERKINKFRFIWFFHIIKSKIVSSLLSTYLYKFNSTLCLIFLHFFDGSCSKIHGGKILTNNKYERSRITFKNVKKETELFHRFKYLYYIVLNRSCY